MVELALFFAGATAALGTLALGGPAVYLCWLPVLAAIGFDLGVAVAGLGAPLMTGLLGMIFAARAPGAHAATVAVPAPATSRRRPGPSAPAIP